MELIQKQAGENRVSMEMGSGERGQRGAIVLSKVLSNAL